MNKLVLHLQPEPGFVFFLVLKALEDFLDNMYTRRGVAVVYLPADNQIGRASGRERV